MMLVVAGTQDPQPTVIEYETTAAMHHRTQP